VYRRRLRPQGQRLRQSVQEIEALYIIASSEDRRDRGHLSLQDLPPAEEHLATLVVKRAGDSGKGAASLNAMAALATTATLES